VVPRVREEPQVAEAIRPPSRALARRVGERVHVSNERGLRAVGKRRFAPDQGVTARLSGRCRELDRTLTNGWRVDVKRLGIALVLASTVACSGDEDDGLNGASGPTDCDVTWRTSTPDQVACPGAADCLCGLPEGCCIPTTATSADVGVCRAAASCATVLFACDGPEDCGAAQVCCAKGQTASCTSETDCFGVEAFVLCHENAHCEGKPGTSCGPGDPGTFWDTVIGVCR